MALTLEEIELTIVQLQEDLRRAKKARTLILKKGKQDARLAEDLDKLLNKDSKELEVFVVDSFISENSRPSLVYPLVSTNVVVDEEEDNQENESDESIALFSTPEEVEVALPTRVTESSSEDLASARPQGERIASTVGALTEEEAEGNIDKFF